MGLIFLLQFVAGFLVSLCGGFFIVESLTRQKNPSVKAWGRSAAICLLLSGLLASIAMGASHSSQATVGSMTQSYTQAIHSAGLLGASLGFALPGFIGFFGMLQARQGARRVSPDAANRNLLSHQAGRPFRSRSARAGSLER